MRIAIFGAGAIGGYMAVKLKQAGANAQSEIAVARGDVARNGVLLLLSLA